MAIVYARSKVGAVGDGAGVSVGISNISLRRTRLVSSSVLAMPFNMS